MSKFLWTGTGLMVSFGLGWLVMIHGWGLTPVSWGWIIWGSIVASVIGSLFMFND